MPKTTATKASSKAKMGRPGLTPEARENQLIALAVDMAEEQLRNRTASSQVVTHFLKLGSIKAQVELEKLKQETELVKAKTAAFESSAHMEELYANAIEAMKSYGGHNTYDD